MTPASLPAVIDQPGAAPPPVQRSFPRPLQTAFLHALADSGSVRAAARGVGVCYRTAYRARRSDPVFRRLWDGALLAARPQAEEVLATRAIDGVEEEVWYHGEVVATRRRYDARLLLAHLGRLDKLADDADAAALAGDFDDALDRFASGEPAAHGEGAGSSPEQCDTCDTSGDAEAAPPPAPPAAPSSGAELQWCEHTGTMVPRVDRLLNAMDAARPAGARLPGEIYGYPSGAVEAEQMAAFEAQVARWWLVVPPGEHDDPEEWTFTEELTPWEPLAGAG
ncbi:hypothetical protein [Parafrankia sp. BMG5.11]|uniref:hypothetical protein n=1 Tax=Parafrankia sp. BMG5.11 TaxID=222540 RepID=UPI00103C6CFD|nr:hypothetical protein [Parafrankia sp. BMG5.11]TCJ39456.1 hypothetical protein E0504_10110 [Parafrankia sp. BMG5.11]